jgi:hypothetical protein
MGTMNELSKNDLYDTIATLIQDARQRVRSTVNSAIVVTYWNIGKLIVEDEQQGRVRAEYGKAVIKTLAKKLTVEFGKGFDYRNHQHMKKFYTVFSKVNAVRTQLSWTHYRHPLKVENEQARNWYMNEAINENWSTRALERQINSLYYERLLASQHKEPVKQEASENTASLQPQDVLKDPYVLEFLQLKNRWSIPNPSWRPA